MKFDKFQLQNYNTFGIQAEAAVFFSYTSQEELCLFLKNDFRKDLPFFILGGGSNVLFTHNYQGTIIHPETKGISIVKEEGNDVYVNVAAGEIWDNFVKWTIEHNFYGAENLSFIPGSVGASPVQNIGAYGVEAKNIIYEVHCLSIDNQIERYFSNSDCRFGYRDSVFKHEEAGKYIVLDVTFKLQKHGAFNLKYGSLQSVVDESVATLQTVRDAIIAIRKDKLPDPKEIGSAGSFFKNPIIPNSQAEALKEKYPSIVTYSGGDGQTKIAAGWLIDSLGFKGYQIGGAKVHQKQALVLTNTGNAIGSDVVQLAQEIQQKVLETYGISIVPEVIYI
ncbi:MAG: UDP-N-acetylmuramate dehydrogenase [Bacteroidales bacterium]|nr:UDP-N-acetylmuramate dehydrogenase [Bacteroidales bacterium]